MRLTNYSSPNTQSATSRHMDYSGFANVKKRGFNDVAHSYREAVTSSLASWAETFGRIYRPDSNSTPEFFSLAGWKARTQEVRKIIIERKQIDASRIEGLRKIYTGDTLKQQTANIDAERRELISTARGLIENDFRFVMQEKRLAHGMALYAPSEAQTRLLSVLNMRASIDPAELTAAATVCADNLQALRLLSDIAKKNGLQFPKIPTEDDFNKAAEQMEEVAKIAADDCAQTDNEMGYFSRLFWMTDTWGANQEAAEQLDKPVYLTVDETDAYARHSEAAAQRKAQEKAAQAEIDRLEGEAATMQQRETAAAGGGQPAPAFRSFTVGDDGQRVYND